MSKRRVISSKTKVCSEDYGVVRTVIKGGKSHVHRNSPCEECPWRMDVPTHVFPENAFKESAPTSYDSAMSTFSCHVTGADKPATCAGFLHRHGQNNLSVRLALSGERIDLSTINDGGLPVYPSYREMAIANGVPEDDPSLQQVRANSDVWDIDKAGWVPSSDGKYG